MQEPYFKLRDEKAEIPTSIRLYVFHSNFPHRRFVYGLKESILPDLWDKETQRPTKDKAVLKEYSKHIPDLQSKLSNLTRKLDDASLSVKNYFVQCTISKEAVSALSLKHYLNTQFKAKAIEIKKEAKKETLNEYIERFIKELERGIRLNNGNRYKDGSIKNFKTFQAQLNEYQKKRKLVLDFDGITTEFYNDFVNFLNSKDYRKNTIGKHIARLKVIMREAMEETTPLHHNDVFKNKTFKAYQIDTEEIYLTMEELNTIQKLNLSKKPHLELYRDIFLIGCHIAQRVSDYNALKPHNVIKLDNGKKALRIIQKKTGNEAIIPIKKDLDLILKKYNYEPPKVMEQNLNDAIKDICEIAEIDERIEVKEIIGGKEVRTIKRKFEMVSSHTARRTGATNMYLAGIDTIDIMKITGHTKESTFLKYIRVTKQQAANRMAENAYFK